MTTRLKPREQEYWHRYLRSVPTGLRPARPRVRAGTAGSHEITDDLIALYLNGRKTAGSSLVADFTSSGDPLPEVGDFWICLDSGGEPRCILRTIRTELRSFSDVPVSVALAEGEGDGSLAHWRRVHSEAYKPNLSKWGIRRIEDAAVITEFFTVVFQGPRRGEEE